MTPSTLNQSTVPPAGPPDSTRTDKKGRRRIVLVEDNPGDADITVERLGETMGTPFDVHHVQTLRGALDQLALQRADAVILDLNLPDSIGLDTLHKVKHAVCDVPIIVVTGLADQHLRTQALAAGAEEVLSKDEANVKIFSLSVLYLIERVRAREQHLQLQRLLDTTPDAILVVNAADEVRYVNQAALTLFRRERGELEGRVFDLPLKGRTPSPGGTDGAPAGAVESSEVVIPHAGSDRVCELRTGLIEWHFEPCRLVIVRDVTERRRLEALRVKSNELALQNQRIREANRLKSQFIANMSHELRTPLNAIIGFSDLMRAGAVDPASEEHRTFLSHISQSGRHLLQLINDILDFARVEAGKIELHAERIDLAQLVGEVVELGMGLSLGKRVAIFVETDPTLTDIRLDPVRFRQVLYNYLSNALKFTAEGGRIVVRTRAETPERFRLEVEDNGIGIAPQDIERLFVEFQQLDPGSGVNRQGTGLGLALTKQLVTAQGGTVGVTSEPGRGSVFHAVLPRCAQPLASAAPTAPSAMEDSP